MLDWLNSLQGIQRDIFVAVLGIILGAILSGFSTYVFTRRKEKREDQKEQKKENQRAFENRPEMEITDFIDGTSENPNASEIPADMECVVLPIQNGTVDNEIVNVHFAPEHLQKDKWVFVEYTLKNVGKTNISALNLVCNYKPLICLFPVNELDFHVGQHILNYNCCYDKTIREGNTVTLKIFYPKNKIQYTVLSSVLSVQTEDENGRCWEQALFAPDNKIDQSRRMSSQEYVDNFKIELAEECFRHPEFW